MEKHQSSSSETTSGSKANRTGNQLERFIEDLLKRQGYEEFWDHKEQLFANRKTVGGKQYAKQVPCGTSIYESKRRCDFLVLNEKKFEDGLIIEAKWQQAAGSVDEKYPFTVFNILKIGVPTIIILDGDGYKKSAMEWLKKQASPDRTLIGEYNMAELKKLVNNGFLD